MTKQKQARLSFPTSVAGAAAELFSERLGENLKVKTIAVKSTLMGIETTFGLLNNKDGLDINVATLKIRQNRISNPLDSLTSIHFLATSKCGIFGSSADVNAAFDTVFAVIGKATGRVARRSSKTPRWG